MIVVQKFGGTSVGSIDRIRHCARLIEKEINLNNSVCVVVSAMAGQTNALLSLTSSFDDSDQTPFQDTIASTGEIVSAGLLGLALTEIGIASQTLAAWQVPILATPSWGRAKITDVFPKKIEVLMEKGFVPIVTGFQGMTLSQELTTLGRGGSDTSAVAIASVLRDARCDIYTDVDGIYSADPRIVSKAFKYDFLSYEEVLEMTSFGAKVLHPRCVEIAQRYKVPLKVCSSFHSVEGTVVREQKFMEQFFVKAISSLKNRLWIKVSEEVKLEVFSELLKKYEIEIDFLQLNSEGFSFCLSIDDWRRISAFLPLGTEISENLSCVSLVGKGIKSHPEVLSKALALVCDRQIFAINLTDMRLSFLISSDQIETLVQKMHDHLIDTHA